MFFQRITVSFTFIVLFFFSIQAQSDIYWVGGNGDWNDVNKWYKDAAGMFPAGIIPNSNSVVHFTDQSSSIPTWNVRFQPGSYDVHSILVETADDFRIFLNGSNNNEVYVNVYGDIKFLSTHRLEYASNDIQDNIWRFQGSNSHEIQSGGLDLFNIEILNTGSLFQQLDNLNVSEQIRMYAGTWNSNSHDITSGRIIFQDNEPSNAPLTKVFNTGSSDILCEEWESGFTYGSLNVTGNHTIRTRRFRGSPMQNNGLPFEFHEIHLLEYTDVPVGGVIIEHNNFECKSCIVESIIIEDTGDTKLADKFTVNGKFTVVNLGSSILFNSGNGRDSEVTLNGLITTPSISDCSDPRTIFSAIHHGDDPTLFKRSNGTLTIKDAILNDIQTDGNAVFNLSSGVLQGSSSGWNLVNPPTPITYFWKGEIGQVRSWANPAYWTLTDGSNNGCIPTISDDVYIDEGSKGDILIPSAFNAECRNFIWTNKDGRELTLQGTNNLKSSLTVTGHFDLNSSAIITPVDNHEIYFSSAGNNYMETRGVALPDIWFLGDLGRWTLQDDLVCDRLTFAGGTLLTDNRNITTDYWNCIDENPKQFNFGSSHIIVNGEMALSRSTNANVTIDAGTSLIECEDLTCAETDLYDVQLNNSSSRLMENYAYNFNSLILNGAGQVSTQNDMTLNDLVFRRKGSALAVDITDDFTINGGIESQATQSVPGKLLSRTSGSSADINKPIGNICVEGYVEFTDINAALSGVFHAPDGIDNGNNNEINFDDGLLALNLYWIGGTGEWQVQDNWSRVSGGCPSVDGPSVLPNLIFDNFGLFNSTETITVPTNQNCVNMFFYNSAKDINLEITNTLSASNVIVNNGDVRLTGNNFFVSQETRVESGGVMTTDMLDHRTEELNASNGLLIVRNGGKFTVKE
jgi:hypothetical protein